MSSQRVPRLSPRLAREGIDALGRDVARSLESARGRNSRIARVRGALFTADPPTLRGGAGTGAPRANTRRALALLVAATLSILAAFVLWPRPSLTFSVGAGATRAPGHVGAFLAAPPSAALPLSFSDDTTLTLAPGAHARVFTLDERGAHVGLERGTVDVHVVHRTATRWTLEAGPFAVRVTGTRFELGWDAATETMTLTLREGSVVVKGCGLAAEGQRIAAGEHLSASCTHHEIASPPAVASVVPSASTKAAGDAVEPTPVAAPAAPAAEADRPDAAVAESADAAVEVSPVPGLTKHEEPDFAAKAKDAPARPGAAPPSSSTELLWRASEARYAHDFDAAEAFLRESRTRFAGSDDAARAAFELGRIAFDARHDPVRATDWFERYLIERPSGELAREALGRALEASLATKDPRATELATRYLTTYPDGPHARLARRAASVTEGR